MFNYRLYRLLLGCTAILFVLSLATSVKAASLEQQMNLLDRMYLATGSAVPTDNSLGFVHWDSSKFSNATVYFEANLRCEACTGGNSQASVTLYTKSGSPVTGATVSTTSSGYIRIRSGDITANLTDDTDFTVRVALDADNGEADVDAARLIIVQSGSTITDTESQVEVGNYASTNNQNYVVMYGPKLFHYDSYYYNPAPTVYFTASLNTSFPDGAAYAILSYSSDCSLTVPGSGVALTGDWNLQKSSDFSLTDGTSYFVCIKSNSTDNVATIANAKIVLDQSASTGIDSTIIEDLIVNTPTWDLNSSYINQPYIIHYDPTHFGGYYFNHYYETTMSANSPVGYADLYNYNDSTSIAGSELSTSNNTLARFQSNTIDLPVYAIDLFSRLKNTFSEATTISGSNLITYVYSNPDLTFKVEGVEGNTVTNGITTTTSSQSNKLDFGSLTPSQPEFLAQKLTVTTNANDGYAVYVKLQSTLQGNYPANVIEEFPTTWDSPEAWSHPNGTTANVNTGWIGANTSDTRVPDWNSASGLFGPLGPNNNLVMYSATPDSGTPVYVTYALDVNQYQPTDIYAGQLTYTVIPTY